MNKIEEAMRLAYEYHEGKLYGNEPYINHLLRVHSSVWLAGWGEKCQIVALLHDIVEDTDIDYPFLYEKFGAEITSAIKAITRKEDETYFDYIRYSVMNNEIARVVKFFDLMENLEHCYLNKSYSDLVSRYKKALELIAIGDAK